MNDPLAVIDRVDGVGGDGQDARKLGLRGAEVGLDFLLSSKP
jgi:hypothetical protein